MEELKHYEIIRTVICHDCLDKIQKERDKNKYIHNQEHKLNQNKDKQIFIKYT